MRSVILPNKKLQMKAGSTDPNVVVEIDLKIQIDPRYGWNQSSKEADVALYM